MAILNELRALYEIIISTIRDFFDSQGSYVKRYIRIIGITIGAFLALTAGYFVYRWYVVSREQNAHAAIANYMHDFQLAMKADTPAEWQRIDGLLALGYKQYKDSNLAPFFLLLRADALVRQDNAVEAVNVLQNAIHELSARSPIMPLFKTKKALILVDSKDEIMQKEGVQDLIQLARDKNNQCNDVALFYLGRYYWTHDNVQDAKKAWQELVDSNAMEKAYPSPWAAEAKKALKQIIQ
jgi:cytochrome c-type biogenesis protein CcmH/NrfG